MKVGLCLMKKTALYDNHIKCGAKMVDFAGYELPIQYSGIRNEHTMVRKKCGMFDVSHMGEILITGKNAFAFIQYIFTNDFTSLAINSARYSPMCFENGGCVDDVLVYKITDDEFLLVVNASNKDKDFEWFKKNNTFDVKIHDISSERSQIAIQGPLSEMIVSQYFDTLPEKYYTFCNIKLDDGSPLIISRTGYTGEDGFEIYCNNTNAPIIWDMMLKIGKDDIIPCGLGSRDTLRLECAMPLYGQELSKDISPIEAGLGYFVKHTKENGFIGSDALLNQKEVGLNKKRYGIMLTDKGVTRNGDKVIYDNEEVGYITSGTKSITLGTSIGLALINNVALKLGDNLDVLVRSKRISAKVVKLPFYKRG